MTELAAMPHDLPASASFRTVENLRPFLRVFLRELQAFDRLNLTPSEHGFWAPTVRLTVGGPAFTERKLLMTRLRGVC